MIIWKSSKKWHTRTRMDDVDYLVEDTAMDEFCLSPEMYGTHGKSTCEDDPWLQLLRRTTHRKLAQWGASWEQNANVGNVPTIICAWDSDLVRNRILQTQHVWKEELQHKSTRWRCEILGEWTTIASSKTWAGSATHLRTRCPRQAWPRSSLTTKHYRVVARNHHRWYQSLVHDLELTQQTPFPWANQSVAWCAREYIWSGGN